MVYLSMSSKPQPSGGLDPKGCRAITKITALNDQL